VIEEKKAGIKIKRQVVLERIKKFDNVKDDKDFKKPPKAENSE
jgi:hypothetical protein|tara:strand:+ start:192 stop:320 length:129 start_codon:yes stop_codon:yes gene_type:complete